MAWSPRGLVRLMLPEGRRGQVEARLRDLHPDAEFADPPGWVSREITRVRRHLDGRPQSFRAARLDLNGAGGGFTERVYAALREVEAGRTVTYGELAGLAGSPGASRAVGRAMATNPLPLIIPCHRVLAAGGKPGGFSAAGGVATKRRILSLEGVELADAPDGELPYDGDEAVRHLVEADPLLGKVIERAGPLRLRLDVMQSPFESLAESIVYQQLTGKAAATIHGRLLGLYKPRKRLRPVDIAASTDEELRGVGLSRAKVAALRDLAAKTESGVVPTRARLLRMENSEIIERLTAIRGIGPWTVEMMLIFRLGRPDVLPVTDYGVRKGFMKAFRKRKLPNAAELTRRGERWRPYRSVAAWYLWRACEA